VERGPGSQRALRRGRPGDRRAARPQPAHQRAAVRLRVQRLQRGDAATVRELAGRGLELSRSAGEHTYAFFNEALLGSLDLALGDYAAAAARLGPLADRDTSTGRSVSRQNVTADAIEALIGAGEREHAAALLAELDRGACRPVLDAIIARCQGGLAASAGDLDGAMRILAGAVGLHDQLEPQPVQRARTLLVLGAIQRRLKQRRAARATLTEAIETFSRVGAALWAERGRAELARVSGRAPDAARLTETEQRVADLIAAGKTNKEAAADLFVTVRAIESTLTKIYAKFGVRSRTQLISALHRHS
jgi:DNA-binding CsgD family transcriptional regulator